MAIYCSSGCGESTLDRSGFEDNICDTCWESEKEVGATDKRESVIINNNK